MKKKIMAGKTVVRRVKYSLMSVGILAGMLLTASVFFTSGCGEGEDGGKSNNSAKLEYTGSTSQATVTSENAESLSLGAYQCGCLGRSLEGGLGLVKTKPAVHLPSSLILARAFKRAVAKIGQPSSTEASLTGVIRTVVDSKEGYCGGTMQYNLRYDDETLDFSGRFTFKDYCDEKGAKLNGTMDLSGNFDATEQIEYINASFKSFTITEEEDSFSLGGQVSFHFGESSDQITMNLVFYDHESSETFKMEDYQMTITYELQSSYVERIVVSGKYYNPLNGYISFSTQTPLIYNEDDDYPSLGLFLCQGKNNTKALLTFLSPAYYQVEADTNGDNQYDWDSGQQSWL